MKMNFYFTVIARCNVYVNNGMEPEITSKDEDIELTFGLDEAERFLFRFSPMSFMLEDYKVVFKYNSSCQVMGVTLLKDDLIYIVKNLNQVINNVLEGYVRMRTMNKLSDVMSFDFDAAIDLLETPEDEFDSTE